MKRGPDTQTVANGIVLEYSQTNICWFACNAIFCQASWKTTNKVQLFGVAPQCVTLKEDIATHKNNPKYDVSQHGFDIASYIITIHHFIGNKADLNKTRHTDRGISQGCLVSDKRRENSMKTSAICMESCHTEVSQGKEYTCV